MLGIIYELRLHCLDPIRDHYLIMEENQAQVGEVFWTPSYPGVGPGVSAEISGSLVRSSSLLWPNDLYDPYFIDAATGDIKIPLWC